MTRRLPEWAHWNPAGTERPWCVGVEEEIMLIDRDGVVANRVAEVIDVLPRDLADRASAETHACVLELKTLPHPGLTGVGRELGAIRSRISRVLDEELELCAFAAGTHPLADASQVQISRGARQRKIASTTRILAEREPTMALHIHVAMPDPHAAVRAIDGLRADLPVVLALAANSPYWRGADSGFASARIPLFSAFPRVGIPRSFGSYASYVEVVEGLLRSAAVPEPGFLWWDARLRPRLGTVEVRIPDAQSTIADAIGVAALVQCLAYVYATGAVPAHADADAETLDESRFLAARDGLEAELLGPRGGRTPARSALDRLLDACWDAAAVLGCTAELALAAALADNPGYVRQRELAAWAGVAALPAWLAATYHREALPPPADVARAVAAVVV
jgi:carboxylate-amine ligase